MTRWPLAGAVATFVSATGCMLGHGDFDRGLAPPVDGAVMIAVIGGAGGQGWAAPGTAAALTQVLDRARATGGRPVVVLPGDFSPHRRARGHDTAAAGPSPVVAAAIAPPPNVLIALAGLAERHHAHGPVAPTPTAVVRIDADGRGEILSRCESGACELVTTAAPGLVDLVALDLEPWRVPPPGGDAAQARVDSLLAAIAAAPGDTPRVLVLSLPVEGAHETGLGAQFGALATFHSLPPSLQRSIASGMFVGVIAGGERSLHVSPDLGGAIQRSVRTWLPAPMWQVVAGNASDPARGRIARRSAWRNGVGHLPPASSFRPGFAAVHVGTDGRVTIDLYIRRRVARRGERWQTHRTTVPLRPAPHPPVAGTRRLTPCLRCDDVPANERP